MTVHPPEAMRRVQNVWQTLTRFLGRTDRMKVTKVTHHEEWTRAQLATPRGTIITVMVGHIHAMVESDQGMETVDVFLSTPRSRLSTDPYDQVWSALAVFRVRPDGRAVPMHLEEMRADREELREWLLEAAA